ncbi:hypothetical protein PENANT_c030G10691 [Penicillium antarcticum]|uniref:Uncharacterized protein n=1 Tax=Penicillium antarcticum TaxID=416450 RepID=A0A1V6PVC5_9EURO|nr:uncharacterized protein N7508_001458 [Penicillium antarcticum]KAJ5316950.1 hypothetical protein N7508_001458 [Penicillium antarcticum]OQD80994.1 hypothetical protein PENANT_c030G10691 [Penicillium antarcticum]
MSSLTDDQHIYSEFADVERQTLIRQIVDDHPGLSHLSRSAFFFLWFSDIRQLRNLAAPCSDEDRDGRYWALTGTNMCDLPDILPVSPSERSRSESPSLFEDAMTPESEYCQAASLQRDKYQCVVTKMGRPTLQSAYIFPSISDNSWRLLQVFFDREQLIALNPEQDNCITEQVSNYLTLSVLVQRFWHFATCAFRPVSINNENTEMEIAFHWLPITNHKRAEKVPIFQRLDLNQVQEWVEGPHDGIRLRHVETEQVIRSGFLFKVTTFDPESQPLPSFALLQLKWRLSRIAAMQGASGEGDRV